MTVELVSLSRSIVFAGGTNHCSEEKYHLILFSIKALSLSRAPSPSHISLSEPFSPLDSLPIFCRLVMFHLTFLSLLLPTLVSAHGFVSQVTIDGTVYKGNSPGSGATTPSIIRQVSSNSPVKGASNPDLNCGLSAQLAQDVAQANPGSQLEIQWSGGTTPGTPVSRPLSRFVSALNSDMRPSGLTTPVRSCTTWLSVTGPALHTSPPTLSGSRSLSLVSSRVTKRGINLRSVSLPNHMVNIVTHV